MLADHLEKLKAFYITAKEGSFLHASKTLGVTQPAVTKTVKFLEDHLNSTLFIRHNKGVSLTSKGILLNEFCESLFVKVRDIEQKLKDNSEFSGIFRIGTYETLGESFWPRALKQIGQNFPSLIVELTTENPETNWLKLESGVIDLIVDAEPKISDRYFSKVLYTDWFGLFCKKDSPFFELKEEIPISYVKWATDRLGTSVDQHIRKFHQQFDLRYSVESFTMVRSLVLEGVCVGVLPYRLANAYVKKGDIVPFIKGKQSRFGEHRICATCADDLQREPKIVRISNALKAIANSNEESSGNYT